jgi:hypothetical protein
MKLKALPLLIALSATAADAAFVISQPNTNGAFGNAATGQSFTPGVGISPDPGVSTTTIELTGVSFWSNGGSAAGSGDTNTIYLLIYDANPAGTANLIGASTNFIDHNPNLAAGTELAWTFNNLTLNYNTTYFAMVASNTTGSLGINDVGIGFQSQNTNPYAGGTAFIDNFVAAAGADLKFTATFANAVPEPSTALLGGLGLLALLRRRRG